MSFRPILRELIQIVLLALVVFFALHTLVQNFRIEGTSMEPNLHNKQFTLVNKAAYWFGNNPSRGDVIVFHYHYDNGTSVDRIKRVIGLPGETVEIRESAGSYRVFIDEQRIDEPYLASYHYGPAGHWTVPEDHYFVMGDNRDRKSVV